MRTTSMKENGLNGQTITKQPSQEEILEALYDFDNLMHRCVLQDSYLSLGDIGKAMVDNLPFEGNGLEFGIERRYLTREVMATLLMYVPGEITEKGFTYDFKGIPIKVRFIDNIYGFFKYPDKKIYGVEEFQVPNPFHKYWKARALIR